MPDGQVVFEINGDNLKLNDVLRDTTSDIERESKKWDKAAIEGTSGIEAAFNKAFDINRVKDWAIEAAKQLGKFGLESLDVASDLQEVQNVVDTTFGENAGVINRWAKSAGEQFGLTELQAKKFTSTLGAMFKSSGMDGDITKISTDLAGLAGDMASFYNLDFQTAFDKIRAGISGETEPLKQLGINMSVANLEAYAMAEGITKSYNEMSQAEQTMLRYKYLMNATTDAQGDFSRTSDSYANSVRTLQNSIEELKATIGEGLLEPVTQAVNAINDLFGLLTGKSRPSTALDAFDEIDEATGKAIEGIGETADTARSYAQVMEDLGDPADFLGSLTGKTDEMVQKQKEWLVICAALTGVIPGLNSVINKETGELNGGVQAVQDYIDAWQQGQEALAIMKSLEAKKAALVETYGDIPYMEFHADALRNRADMAAKEFEEAGGDAALFNAYGDEYNNLTKLRDKADELEGAATQAENAVARQRAGYDEAAQMLDADIAYFQEKYSGLIPEDESEEASANAQSTVDGITSGINAGIPGLASAVDAVNAELARIGTAGSVTVGGTSVNLGGGASVDGSHALGLDYVPFDNYLAQLHEGESILTAEEARIWRQFKNGGQAVANTIDYEAMGGLMRDNIKPGGDVYLDGRIVGQVISQQQGNSLRNLERSGWQR
jgi:hypothetical protein